MEAASLTHDLIFDVGLHKGEDSAYYLAKGYRVIAFEANLALITLARQRFASFPDGRFEAIHGAISTSRDSTVEFYEHPLSMLGTTNRAWVDRNKVVGNTARTVQVPTVRIADSIRQVGMPAFVKIDIEGSDLACLAELLQFSERPISVSIESTKLSRKDLEAEFALLAELGYDRFAVVQQATVPNSDVTTRTTDDSSLRYQFEADASGGFGSDVGPWLTFDQALKRYRRVFAGYRLASVFDRGKLFHRFVARAQGATGVPMPGWFDTHAANSRRLEHPVFWPKDT